MNASFNQRLLICGGILFLLAASLMIWLARSYDQQGLVNHSDTTDRPVAQDSIESHTKAIKRKQSQARLLAEDEDIDFIASTPTKLSHVFAPSLEGTEIDGRLKADTSGQLVVDLEVRDFFDYFLNAVGDVEPEQALAEIGKIARDNLPPTAANQAMALLDQYLAFKEEAVQLMSQPIPNESKSQIESLQWAFNELKRIRRETMSSEAVEAFFSMEEAYSEYTLASIRIQSDESLSERDKAALIAYERDQLPEPMRLTEETLISEAQKHAEVEQMIAAGDEQGLVDRLRTEGYEEEQILSILDYQRTQQQFDERYAMYRLEKEKLSDSGLSVDDQQLQLENLRAQYFSSEQELTQAKVRDLKG